MRFVICSLLLSGLGFFPSANSSEIVLPLPTDKPIEIKGSAVVPLYKQYDLLNDMVTLVELLFEDSDLRKEFVSAIRNVEKFENLFATDFCVFFYSAPDRRLKSNKPSLNFSPKWVETLTTHSLELGSVRCSTNNGTVGISICADLGGCNLKFDHEKFEKSFYWLYFLKLDQTLYPKRESFVPPGLNQPLQRIDGSSGLSLDVAFTNPGYGFGVTKKFSTGWCPFPVEP